MSTSQTTSPQDVKSSACGVNASLSSASVVSMTAHDPDVEVKAGRILDLYHRVWKGRRLRSDEFVISADEKTSIQARARKHPLLKTQSGRPMRIEHEYKRLGAWAYLAALDVHRFRLF